VEAVTHYEFIELFIPLSIEFKRAYIVFLVVIVIVEVAFTVWIFIEAVFILCVAAGNYWNFAVSCRNENWALKMLLFWVLVKCLSLFIACSPFAQRAIINPVA